MMTCAPLANVPAASAARPSEGLVVKTVEYGRARLTQAVVGCPIFVVAGILCLGRVGSLVAAIIVIGALVLTTFAILAARKLFGDPTALRYDSDKLTIITMWTESTVRWRDVATVGTSALNSYAFYGLIKVGSTQYLDIKMKGGLLAKKYRVLSDMLDLDRAGIAALIDDLAAHQIAAAGAPARPLDDPAARAKVWAADAPQAEIFDADAALANYMRRSKQPEAAPPEPAANFGRRDPLEGAPQPSLAGPRPGGFGRKGL